MEGRGGEGREIHRVRQSNVKRMDVERRGLRMLHRIIYILYITCNPLESFSRNFSLPLPSTTNLVMELVPTVQVKCIKFLHVFRTDHTLVLSICQWLSRSLLGRRGHSNRPPHWHLHLHVHHLLLGKWNDRHMGQFGFCYRLNAGGDRSLWVEPVLGGEPLSHCSRRGWPKRWSHPNVC